MNDDAINAPSPLWVRVLRMLTCLTLGALLAWRGAVYDDPHASAAIPFVMCEFSAVVLGLLGLMSLDSGSEPGPT